jgi:hypothetical protein
VLEYPGLLFDARRRLPMFEQHEVGLRVDSVEQGHEPFYLLSAQQTLKRFPRLDQYVTPVESHPHNRTVPVELDVVEPFLAMGEFSEPPAHTLVR